MSKARTAFHSAAAKAKHVLMDFKIDLGTKQGWQDRTNNMRRGRKEVEVIDKVGDVYLERILRKPKIDAFAKELKPHQIEAVIHFDDDTEELQRWDQQTNSEATVVLLLGRILLPKLRLKAYEVVLHV
ncbi:hypothetical protein JHK82_042806 [Glycine max]|nr:hypothetical protein JHK86_042828 [Glycine max]KAG4957086.1 hypothetical protein JHK85_043466 [Glycine max]KAG5105836.1 hypothetical protein JHK82_042806 [Glycine max]